jgi:hypothetical protein
VKKFVKLYIHEIKKTGDRFLMVFIAFLFFNGLILLRFPHINQMTMSQCFSAEFLYKNLMWAFFVAPPVLLALTIHNKADVRNDYLSFSLPLHRTTIFLSRYLAAFTVLILSLLTTFLWSLFMVPLEIHERELGVIHVNLISNKSYFFAEFIPYYHDFWGFLMYETGYFYFMKIGLLLSFVAMGIVTFSRSLRYKFRWFSEFFSNLSILIFFILFCLFGLQPLVPKYPLLVGTENVMNSVIAGLLFLAIGLFLFEKYGEV